MLEIKLHDVVNNLDFHLRATPTMLWFVFFRTRLGFFAISYDFGAWRQRGIFWEPFSMLS